MDTKRGAGVEKTLINRIIFVLNVFILGVNITFALKNVKDYETISASADEQESTTIDVSEETTSGLPTEDDELTFIEAGRDDFNWTTDSNDTKKIILEFP